jgi:hypothetical protein
MTSCGRARHRCHGVARVLDRRGGASGSRGGCRRSRPISGS